MKAAYLFLAALFFMFSCEKNNNDPVPAKPADLGLSKSTTDIIEADNAFGLDLFTKVLKNDAESDNIFVSPTSVALALAMTYNGSAGDTRAAMETALHKQGFTDEEINNGYKSLIDALKSVDPKVILEIANSIWYKEGFTVLPDFININRQFYNAEVDSLDFSDPSSAGTINGWVNVQTHGKINKIIDGIPGDAVMYLINAIYFKGIWQYEFDKSKTFSGSFTANGGSSVSVDYMTQSGTFQAAQYSGFDMIELPYGRGNFSMVILLPKNDNTVDNLADSITNENWNTWISGLKKRNVDLFLPKFTYSYSRLLNPDLTGMGMGVAFSDGADFSGINGYGGLKISRVIHKSFVEVNEQGTEAAAVTAVEIVEASYPGANLEFNVNRPFMFAIRETTTGAVLFMGRVNNPLTKENGD
ncbi:MAG TPA: serpin family protein [Bacteroidales bacterium]|nr:serpin family protein [Bacteroidales bacterium]